MSPESQNEYLMSSESYNDYVMSPESHNEHVISPESHNEHLMSLESYNEYLMSLESFIIPGNIIYLFVLLGSKIYLFVLPGNKIYLSFLSGNPSSTTFDLTLMIVLIRNLTPIRISDVVLHSSDVTEGADLSRLKYYRNQIAHNDSVTLTDRQFQEWWNDITEVILELWLE